MRESMLLLLMLIFWAGCAIGTMLQTPWVTFLAGCGLAFVALIVKFVARDL